MKKKIIILLLLILSFKTYAVSDVFIAYKIENNIITNIDILKESKYLMALNTQLKNLENKKILKIAEQSIVKETIKKIELIKYYNLDQTNPYLDTVIKNLYIKVGLNNKEEFKTYLKKQNLTINEVKKKIEIETTWNQFIYQKYKNQINIDKEALEKRVNNIVLSEDKVSYLLSEIVFEKNKDEPIKEKVMKINESIKEIGFKNTANLYSITDSAKFGGDIGWIQRESLSKKVSKIIANLDINEHSKPIQIRNGFLILKIENIKNEKIAINKEKELKKMIQSETDKQLEQFSKIYFNKIKINTNISEL